MVAVRGARHTRQAAARRWPPRWGKLRQTRTAPSAAPASSMPPATSFRWYSVDTATDVFAACGESPAAQKAPRGHWRSGRRGTAIALTEIGRLCARIDRQMQAFPVCMAMPHRSILSRHIQLNLWRLMHTKILARSICNQTLQ